MIVSIKLPVLIQRIISVALRVIQLVGVLVISLLLLLPVILAPWVTSIPKPLVGGLFLLVLVAILLPLRVKLAVPAILTTWLGFLIISILTIIFSQVLATTPPILGTDGKPLPGSIASLEQVDIRGTKQWITIRGNDATKPVLLYLGIGGPGAGGLPATFTSLKPLEEHFVVVNWDQPGTGKSYFARDINSLTPQLVVDDAKALTQYLKQRFNQKKIYVMGLSWGTIVGIQLIQQDPDSYYAYVGNGQMVNTVENDRFGYELALKLTEEQGDVAMHNRLQSYGPPPYTGNGMALKFADYNNVLFDHMDSPNIPMIMALVPQLAPEYGYVDKILFDLGLIQSFPVLYSQLNDLDFIQQAPKLNVPVYFLVGEKDVNAVASIVDRYYQALEAPHKELIWVKSGHGATADEIRDTFLNQVLVSSPPSN